MNRLVVHIRNLFSNIFRFGKLAVKNEEIFRDYLSANIVDCKIDKEAKVHGFCSLTNVSVVKATNNTFNAKISNTSIDKICSIGPNLFCGWGIHPLNGVSTSPAFYSTKKQNGFTFSETDKVEERKPIQIGNDVFIGANVTILDGVTIGDGAVIGAGSVVNKDIPAYAVAAGCPIGIIKYRFEKKIIESLLDYKWWDKDENVLRRLEKNFFNVQQFLEKNENQ